MQRFGSNSRCGSGKRDEIKLPTWHGGALRPTTRGRVQMRRKRVGRFHWGRWRRSGVFVVDAQPD
jgi:hypothetical protein